MGPTHGSTVPTRFEAVQSALTTAEHDFLHAIGDPVDLTWERYAALVAELHARREALVHEVEDHLRGAEAPDASSERWLGLLYATERAKLGP